MYMDFHTHGKLAKYLPFSTEYTDWLLREARRAGLDAICLTEHFNTQQFDTLYGYVEARGEKNGDAYVFEDAGGLRVFPGMETDIAEGGHVLCVGPMGTIREMNRRLEPHTRIAQAVAQPIIRLPRIRGELLVKPHRYPPLPLKAFLSSIEPLQFFHWKNQPA